MKHVHERRRNLDSTNLRRSIQSYVGAMPNEQHKKLQEHNV